MPIVNQKCPWDTGVGEISVDVDLYVDDFDVAPSDAVKVLFLCEPRSIIDFHHARKWLGWDTFKQFDHILTFDDEVLARCPNAHLFEFGSTWIKDGFCLPKEFSVSFVCGNKRMAPGHALRHELWKSQSRIRNRRFFASRHGCPSGFDAPTLGDTKDTLFKSQFHVAIENSKINNYFSEKVMDCFVTRTVPIYWGCPNIGNYFNVDGMFLVDTAEDIVTVANSLGAGTYDKMMPHVEDNFQRAQKWKNLGGRLTEKIQQLIDVKL